MGQIRNKTERKIVDSKTRAEQFKEKATELFKGKYTYDNIETIESLHAKVECYCTEHKHYFTQEARRHLSGYLGCKECSSTLKKENSHKQLNTEEFIEKANKIHNNFYSYDKTNYINNFTKVIITCPIHGDFAQLPANHLKGYKCHQCNGGTKYSNEYWIEKAKEKYGDKYDYSNTNYISQTNYIDYKCNICGEVISQMPCNHMAYGCPNCSKLKRGTPLEEFIEKARLVHGNKYDYSLITDKIIYLKNKVKIICPKHGEFEQQAGAHLRGAECIKCANNVMTHDELIEKFKTIHGDRYDYSKVEYNGYNTQVCIICKEHGEFFQTPHAHINGKGCSKCVQSHLENEIYLFLTNNNIEFETQKRFDWLGKQSLDFYLPKLNVGIECQGEQHFKETRFSGSDSPIERLIKCQTRDENKKILCDKNDVKLIYFSNLGIIYPYTVIEDKGILLKIITSFNK